MYEKIKNFGYKFDKPRFFLPLISAFFLIWVFASLIVFIFSNSYISLNYPEQDYKTLETEAMRIISQKDFTSKYDFTITEYNNKTNNLEFILKTEEATLNVFSSNKSNIKKIVFSRKDDNIFQYLVKRFFSAIFYYIVLAALTYIAFICIYSVILMFAYIIHNIKQLIKKTSAKS